MAVVDVRAGGRLLHFGVELQALEDGTDDAIAASGVEQKGSGAGCSGAFHELRPQHLVCPMQSDLDVGIAEGEDLGGVGGAHFFKIAEDKNGGPRYVRGPVLLE